MQRMCKVYLYRLHTLGASDLCEGLTSIPQQGLFVPFGSGDLCEGLMSNPQQGLFVPFGSGDLCEGLISIP